MLKPKAAKTLEPTLGGKPIPDVVPDPKVEDKGWGPGLMDVGDELYYSMGAEKYFPTKYDSFEVGPFGVKLHLRAGEEVGDMYMRAVDILHTMFQAEYELKRKHFHQRSQESEKDK